MTIRDPRQLWRTGRRKDIFRRSVTSGCLVLAEVSTRYWESLPRHYTGRLGSGLMRLSKIECRVKK